MCIRDRMQTRQGAHPSIQGDFPDRVIGGVGKINCARTVGRHTRRMPELDVAPGTTVTAAISSQRAYHSVGRNLANGVVGFVRDQDIAYSVQSNTARRVKLRAVSRTILAAPA